MSSRAPQARATVGVDNLQCEVCCSLLSIALRSHPNHSRWWHTGSARSGALWIAAADCSFVHPAALKKLVPYMDATLTQVLRKHVLAVGDFEMLRMMERCGVHDENLSAILSFNPMFPGRSSAKVPQLPKIISNGAQPPLLCHSYPTVCEWVNL